MSHVRTSEQWNDRHVGGELRDRGSMLVFTAMVGIAICAAVTLALVPVLTGLVERQQAQSAADAAALAGVSGGQGAVGRTGGGERWCAGVVVAERIRGDRDRPRG